MSLDLSKKLTARQRERADEILASWQGMNKSLGEIETSDTINLLIVRELEAKRRMAFLARLVARYGRLAQTEAAAQVLLACRKR
jgi:hypothetical protein